MWRPEIAGTTARGSGGGEVANTEPTYVSFVVVSCPDPFWNEVPAKIIQRLSEFQQYNMLSYQWSGSHKFPIDCVLVQMIKSNRLIHTVYKK